MSDIWQRWEQHYQKMGIKGGACKDGILAENEMEFRKQKTRILFVLRDTNSEECFDLREYLKDGPRYCYWNVARWAYGILENFPLFEKVPNGREELKQYLMKVAVINIKKTPGKGKSKDLVIRTYARQDRKFLLEQIRAVQPTMIVACGTIEPVIELLDLAAIPEKLKDAPVEDQVRKAWVIRMRHPNRAPKRDSYNTLESLVRQIRPRS